MQNLDNRMLALEEAEAKRQKSKTAKSDAKAAPGPQPSSQRPPQTDVAANPPANAGVSTQASAPPAKAFPLVSPTNFNVGPFNVKVFGRATLDVIYNTARPQAPGTPFYLVPTFVGGFPQNTIDLNARQSMLGVTFTGPMIGDFQTGGRVSAVFFDNTILADRNGFLLQQSYGELFNENWRFAAGLQFDVFAPGFPTVLPFSGLGGSGSAGNSIKGQIRAERFVPVGNNSRLTLQVALSEPQKVPIAFRTPVWTRITVGRTWKDVLHWVWESRYPRHRRADAASAGGRCLRRGRPASQDRHSTRRSATGCFRRVGSRRRLSSQRGRAIRN